jgi:FkbM family methyltransferase
VLSWFGFGVYKINSAEIINFWNLLFLVLKEEGHVRYLQIGANDGVLVDPMYEFVCENRHRVSGLLVEPVEIYFQKLKDNYATFHNITTVRRGIHNFENLMTIFVAKVTRNHHQNIAVAGLSSFNKGHLLKNKSVIEADIVEEQVRCSSVEELLQEFDFNDINVLVIDTEGYDFQILDKLDLNQVSPKIVLFEHGLGGGTMTPIELESLCEKFNKFGYQVTIVNNDAIAVQTKFMVKCLLQLESNPVLEIK